MRLVTLMVVYHHTAIAYLAIKALSVTHALLVTMEFHLNFRAQIASVLVILTCQTQMLVIRQLEFVLNVCITPLEMLVRIVVMDSMAMQVAKTVNVS